MLSSSSEILVIGGYPVTGGVLALPNITAEAKFVSILNDSCVPQVITRGWNSTQDLGKMKDLDSYLIQDVGSTLHYLEDIIISDTERLYLLLNNYKYCMYLKKDSFKRFYTLFRV